MKTIKLPIEGENVYRLRNDIDLGICAIWLAWKEVCKQTKKMLWLRNIVISNTMRNWYETETKYLNYLDSFKCLLPYDMNENSDRGKILEAECIDQDTWWLLFEDINGNKQDEIFYSPGA